MKTAESRDLKIRRQAKHVLDRLRKESAAKPGAKKSFQLLAGPIRECEQIGGVQYLDFIDSMAVPGDTNEEPLAQVKVKKEKKVADGTEEVNDLSAGFRSEDDDHSEVVFAEEEEYGGDEDDFGAVNDDDE